MGFSTDSSLHRRAFTLIELLVSISIIGLLVSLAVPGLHAAREQAKRVVCQANMKSVNTALLMYVSETDTYPVLMQVNPRTCGPSWATWSFGGWTGRDFETYCDSEARGTFCYQTYQRPLSVYLVEPNSITPDTKGADGRFGTPDDLTTEMPMFRCPSDKASTQWRWRTPNASQRVQEMSAYDQCGSSYQMNYYWFHQARVRAKNEVEPGRCFNYRLWSKAFEMGRQLWRRADQFGGAVRFVTLVEDPFDWGIAQNLEESANAEAGPEFRHHLTGEQTMGFHGVWTKHMLAFLDGHVEYTLADTRYQREGHWTVTNDTWYDTRRRQNSPPFFEADRDCPDR
jgi:prepilin-type N-terminal cleavage/methylation domain-containing protein